ncbi:predicted protein [Nematostella vectensis]|uniref:inositol-1,4-bisphosphate 1-phosphatase n=1 Tax=Nematostella vectensis TaxID=45351 RepID=A7SL18_NEMVE|nr:predicted protein [Nematostella vectensis]|eukprot:XP_001627665.1 predicted protein [Nematostella vectensis]
MMDNLIRVLLRTSEKSASIARAWITQKELFSLLVEEKTGKEKNERFVADFKTLADVIVQEVVKRDVIQEFPHLKGHIHGEESNKFTLNDGHTITIAIQDTPRATAEHLGQVLPGHEAATHTLADIIHNDTSHDDDMLSVQSTDGTLDLGNIGIWIDPIDGTAQYMSGSHGVFTNGLLAQGLPCVCVLIGVYDEITGQPIAGVINQPFIKYNETTQTWTGGKTWGYSLPGCNRTSIKNINRENNNMDDRRTLTVTNSASETEDVIRKLKEDGISCLTMSTVGYKLLKVIDSTVDAYVLSRATSFKWDTCAAHAIIRAMGGGVVNLGQALKSGLVKEGASNIEDKLRELQICYSKPDQENYKPGKKWSNSGGLVAYMRCEDLLTVIKALT